MSPSAERSGPRRGELGTLRLRSAAERWAVALVLPAGLWALYAGVGSDDLRLSAAFVVIVVLVGILSGPKPATACTVIAGFGFWHTIIPPADEWGKPWPEGPTSLIVFSISCAIVIAVIDERDRRADDALDLEHRVRALTEDANQRLRLVARTSEDLMRATQPSEVIGCVVDSLSGSVAPYVAVFVPEGGLLRRAGTRHVDDPSVARALTGRFPVGLTTTTSVAESFRSGAAVRFGTDGTPTASLVSDDPEYAAVMAGMELGAGVVVPMRARGAIHGVVVLGCPKGAEPLDPDDIAMVQTVADRAGAAYLNTSDLQTERAVATRLQEALLPTRVDLPPNLALGAVYVPASEGRRVGGDWWDAFALPDRRCAFAVGDVAGHGVEVAAVMAELRNAIRGLLIHGASPAEALNSASDLLAATRTDELATAFVAIVDHERSVLTYSSAGHPPALLVRHGAPQRLMGGRGTVLGLDHLLRTDAVEQLVAPVRLVAYTDGLVETRRAPIDDGIDRLASLAAEPLEGGVLQARAERIVADMVGTDTNDDDVCLVVLDVAGPTDIA